LALAKETLFWLAGNRSMAIYNSNFVEQRKVLGRFLFLFLPLCLLLFIIFGLIFYSHTCTQKTILCLQEAHSLDEQQEVMAKHFKSIIADLKILASHHELQALIADKVQSHKPELQQELLTFVRFKEVFDQVRYLDHTGMEVIRVNFNNGAPSLVAENDLQAKGNRYYFLDTMALAANRVYISPFDLNIEQGRIEKPLKPMIRLGIPVFDNQKQKKGAIILNYLGGDLLNTLTTLSEKTPGHIMMLNPQGYWLKGMDPRHEWGFMYPDRKEATMDKKFPGAWRKISADHTGQFQTDDGLFTFTTVVPFANGIVSSSGSDKAFMPSKTTINQSEYFWKLVSFVPAEQVKAGYQLFFFKMSWAAGALLLFFAGGCWLLAQAVERRNAAEKALKKANEELEKLVAEGTSNLTLSNKALSREIVEHMKVLEEKERVETQLRQSQKMEAIGTMAGGIAHDFNNILTPILGYVQMAQEELPEESEIRKDLGEVLKASNRAKELVKQILTFSRQTEEERKPVQVQLIIKEALKLMRSSLPSTIEIRQKINPGCGMVLAEPTQIHQVLMNLCTNAYHAMRDTGGILGVELEEKEITSHDYLSNFLSTPGRYLRLAISDTGHGIDQEQVERIFEPYFTTKEMGEGTGLGLSVVHSIVKGCQGHITVYSEVGKGTTFHVYLPAIENEESVMAGNVAKQVVHGDGEMILVVDDEESVLMVEQVLLKRLGYRVIGMMSSVEALSYFEQNSDKIDLLLTDLTMPGMTGIQLSQEILKIRPDFPIILCTGFSEIISEEKAKAAGIREYVVKPIVKMDIAKAIRRALGG
jgi:signal transduction histidine kinase/ActR/RegA family two-component response regulator